MTTYQKTIKGFALRRRCDDCGNAMSLALDTGDKCILVCLHCGKEYRFTCRAA